MVWQYGALVYQSDMLVRWEVYVLAEAIKSSTVQTNLHIVIKHQTRLTSSSVFMRWEFFTAAELQLPDS